MDRHPVECRAKRLTQSACPLYARVSPRAMAARERALASRLDADHSLLLSRAAEILAEALGL